MIRFPPFTWMFASNCSSVNNNDVISGCYIYLVPNLELLTISVPRQNGHRSKDSFTCSNIRIRAHLVFINAQEGCGTR